MKKKYTAIMKMENGGHIHKVDYDYSSKKDFAHDIRANGYGVSAILTDDEIQRIKDAGWRSGLKYSNLVIDFVLQCL